MMSATFQFNLSLERSIMIKTIIIVTSLIVILFSSSLRASNTGDLTLLLEKATSVDYQDIQHARKIATKLNQQASHSEEVLTLVLNALQQSPNNTLFAKYLLPDLALNPSKKVTNTALMLLTSKQPNDQLIGLEIISSRKINNSDEKEALLIALFNLFDVMSNEQVIDNVFGLLQSQSFSKDSYFRLAQALQPLCKHPNESIRSNSYFAIARFAQDEHQLLCIVDSLKTQSNVLKTSAIMALSQSNVKGSTIKNALNTFANDQGQSQENRASARQILTSY